MKNFLRAKKPIDYYREKSNTIIFKKKKNFLSLALFLPIEIFGLPKSFFTPDICHIRQIYGQICDLNYAKLHL